MPITEVRIPTDSKIYARLSQLNKAMYLPEVRRIAADIQDLHKRNMVLTKENLDGFMFRGEFYKAADAAVGKGARKTLHLDLWREMDAILADRAKVAKDMAMIKQSLFALLTPCRTMQDMRDALPEPIVSKMDDLNRLPRTRPEAYTIANDERAVRQLAKIRSKIDFYAMAALLY